MKDFLSGYRTLIGAVIMAVSAGLNYAGMTELGEAAKQFGFAILAVGIGGKIEKSGKQ